MGTIADKLTLLSNTKAAIKDAIIAKGQTVADDEPFSSYAGKIAAIETGGGSAPATPLDPQEVYQNTRPADWLPMPEPQADEVYLLFHIPVGLTSLIAFTATCTGNYKVELGTMAGGAFVPASEVSLASGTTYEAELAAEDYENVTSDGMAQCMIKVSGSAITKFVQAPHSKKTTPSGFAAWDIVEVSCNLPSGAFKPGMLNGMDKALRNMRFYSAYTPIGNGARGEEFFSNCRSLIAIPKLNTIGCKSANYMFQLCFSLIAFPALELTSAENALSMFQSCYSLKTIPQITFDNSMRATSGMFENCYSLTTIPPLYTQMVETMSSMFKNCRALKTIPAINTKRVNYISLAFDYCYNLSSLKLDPTVTGWVGGAISLNGCSLGHTALVELFNSLPTITGSYAITLTGNPGVPDLTDADKAIATGKGWTLTL